MNDLTDQQLLRDYAADHADAVFAELVRRHVDLVYSAARRMVCDPHLAEDVTQTVFLALAKNAGLLTDRPVLSGWLHRTAENLAANTVRAEVRRRTREQEALAMSEMFATEPAAAWEQIAAQLDAALGELSEPDRDALLLRYFERKSASEMAQTLGISDEAAQKRVSRAVEKLRERFAKRGVTVGAVGLAVVITANAVQAAPVGLAATISTAATLAGTTVATSTTATLAKTIAMTTLQKTLVTATVAVLAGAGIYEARQAAQLREQNQTLQQQTPMAGQFRQLQMERDDATNRLALLADEIEKLKSNNAELLKLRSEVTRLRQANDEASKAHKDSRETLMKSWLAREDKLRQSVEQNPDKSIPDLKLLSDQDWLSAAKDAKFDTDKDVRQTLANLRHMAENSFASSAAAAVTKYMAANNHEFPTDLSQLQPFFDAPMDEAILQRWHIVPQTALPNQRMGGDWLITQIAPVDRDLDQSWAIGPGSYGASSYQAVETSSAIVAIGPALKAYAAANNGKEPTDPSQILPYLTTPEQQAAYQTLLNSMPGKNSASQVKPNTGL